MERGQSGRRRDRKDVSIEVRIDGVPQHRTFRLSDISVGGGFVDSPAQVQPGDRIQLALMIGGQRFEFGAVVAHVQRTIGFGFAFSPEEMTPEARAALEQFVDSV